MLSKTRLAILALGSLLTLIPSAAFARDRDDRRPEHVQEYRDRGDYQQRYYENQQWRRHDRDGDDDDRGARRDRGYYYDRGYPNYGYGYYDQSGCWHPYAR